MFNALTSIQGLMNKNDIPAANHYLALFANLTRKVLNTTDQDLISLEDELKIQEDYLQMEQLRFGFQYQITVGEEINIANTEIPAMLLQPFVENAVKHGVALLQQNGSIHMQINKQVNNLSLSVTDNGKGFDKEVTQQKDSLGLKLSEEHIALLNQVNPDQPVVLNIDSKQTGTTITITFINLFS
jgi:LytS/YehU family sensor histidine kinase